LNEYPLRIIKDIIGWMSQNRYVLLITMDITEYRLDSIDGYFKRYIEWIHVLDNNGKNGYEKDNYN
jgi:hypothetical protein